MKSQIIIACFIQSQVSFGTPDENLLEKNKHLAIIRDNTVSGLKHHCILWRYKQEFATCAYIHTHTHSHTYEYIHKRMHTRVNGNF